MCMNLLHCYIRTQGRAQLSQWCYFQCHLGALKTPAICSFRKAAPLIPNSLSTGRLLVFIFFHGDLAMGVKVLIFQSLTHVVRLNILRSLHRYHMPWQVLLLQKCITSKQVSVMIQYCVLSGHALRARSVVSNLLATLYCNEWKHFPTSSHLYLKHSSYLTT